MENRIFKKISILTSAILIYLTSVSFAIEGRYLIFTGGKAVGDIGLVYNSNSEVGQDPGNGFAIGIGKKNFGLGSNIGYEVDFSPGFQGASGEGLDEPCLASWGQGACSVKFKNIINAKFIINTPDELVKISGFQTYAIAGLSSANIKSHVDSGAIGGSNVAGDDTTLTDERRLGYIVGFGIDKDINNIVVGLNYTITDYGDVSKGPYSNYSIADYRLKLLNFAIKSKF